MSYTKPGVTVTQEFTAASAALAAFALPCVKVGPAYQLVDDDAIGTYAGSEQSYAYASALGGSIIDAAMPDPNEEFPITKKPIEVNLHNVVIEILPQTDTGSGNGTAFSDVTSGIFDDVLAGDKVTVVAQTAISIVAAQVNGVSSDTAGMRNRLTAGVAGQFASVKVGDSVVVTGGTNAIPGTYLVTIKLSTSVLVLDGNINDGVGPSADTAYSITGNRGVANAGSYTVKTKTDANNLVLTSPLPDSPEAPLRYYVRRNLSSTVAVERAAVAAPGYFTADEDAITMPAAYEVNTFPVVSANVFASYRALRTDLASEIKTYADIAAIEAVFGVGQITPANPLPYALSIAKSNTVTAVGGLALGATYATDEALAYTKALDVLALEDKYALTPLTFNPVVHAAFEAHVDQLSLPNNKLERVAIFNSKLNIIGLVQAEKTTSTSLTGARSIVTTQIDGSGAVANPTILNDATPDQFMNVEAGDTVTVVSGTGVTPGAYAVISKQSSNQITLATSFITAGSPTDIVYYIQRKDGLGADGVTFYDRNASFISNGAAAGHFLKILAGTYEGSWMIGSVVSEKQIVLAEPILGVVSLLTAVNYEITRELSKDEQAENIAGYSSSFANRRCVHTWPDVLQAPVGSNVYDIPGYYGSVSIGALTTGLPTQQGFTNLTVVGFLGLSHSTKYFTETQFNTIADGGTLIFVQEGPQQPLLVRHQLTTDRSSIKFQEYSVTKNVDFCAKYIRNSYKPPVGKYNIVDTTLDFLKTTATADIKFLRDKTRLPFIGGNIRAGELLSFAEDPDLIDAVNMRFKLRIPIPLNHIDIVLEV
jgi:hypothetical protein